MLHGSSSAGEEQGAVQNEEKREGAEPLSKVIDGIKKDLAAIPKMAKEKTHRSDLKKQVLLNLPYLMVGYFCNKAAWLSRSSDGTEAS